MKKSEAKIIRRISWILFIVYILILIYFMFLSEAYGRTIADRSYHYNLIPFKELNRFITYRKSLGTVAVMTNIFGNIMGFIPFGYILPIISKRRRKFSIIGLLSFQLSLSIEVLQLVLKVGSFDVDDLILNTLGGLIGYFLFWISNKIRRKYDGKKVDL